MTKPLPFGFTWSYRACWMNLAGYEIHLNETGNSYRLIFHKNFQAPIGCRYRSIQSAARAAEKHFKTVAEKTNLLAERSGQ